MSHLFNNNQEIKNDEGNPIPIVGTTTNPWGRQVLLVDDDTVQHTSHNRRKTSTYEITDFATFPFSKNQNDFDEIVVGTASATHRPYLGMVELTVGDTIGDSIIRQTRRVQRYLPGRANEASMAVIFNDLGAGVRARCGIFDDFDGAYFEAIGSSEFNVVIRRNTAEGIVEERVERANWNQDKLDGNGPSGITADPTKIQMMVIEYEWYGAGQVEFKFVINNNAYSVHQFNHANIHDHTWASRAALPIRFELTNVTGGSTSAQSILQGSHSFLTEGTTTLLGKQVSTDLPITGKTIANANTFYPLVAIRLKTTALNSVVIPDEWAAGLLDKTDLFVQVIQDPTVIGGTWVSAGSESPVEYNVTATSFTGGSIDSTFFISEKQMGGTNRFAERAITQLFRKTTTTLGDTPAIFMIAGAAVDPDKLAWASLGWIEVR